jgi:uncharacterized tellurite resistance protein B-like protein
MRSFPRNSPDAAARIVVLALLSDGHLSRTEIEGLLREQLAEDLGLSGARLADLVQSVSEDLLATGFGTWSDGQALDPSVVAGALAEVDDPALRERTLALCIAAIRADGHLSDGEHALLAQVARRWTMPASLAA